MSFSKTISEDGLRWMADNFNWAIDKRLLTADTPLVLPTSEYFPERRETPEQGVARRVEDLRLHLRLSDPVEVRPLDPVQERFRADFAELSGHGEMRSCGGLRSVIRYDRALIGRPGALLAMLAHDLMRHRLADLDEFPPGGPEAEELAVDLHVVSMGLGVIAMAGAEGDGWPGHITQAVRARALALFLYATARPADAALDHLPKGASAHLRDALAAAEVKRAGAALCRRLQPAA